MEKLYPQDPFLRQYIDYYWVIDENNPAVKNGSMIFDFPSLSPELVIGLEGSFTYTYNNTTGAVNGATLFAFIEDKISIDISGVKQVVIVRFQPNGLAAFAPFTSCDIPQLKRHAIVDAKPIVDASISKLENSLDFTSSSNLIDQLDSWFKQQFKFNKGDFLADVCPDLDTSMSVQQLTALTGVSYSTLERRFKFESGISPKQFLMLNRFRHVMEAINSHNDTDWFDLVVDYGYHDQNHLIKEVKRFSGFTPTELMSLHRLKAYRPETAEEFLL